MVSELIIETENSIPDSEDEKKVMEVDMDDDVLLNRMEFEEPDSEIDFKQLGELLTLSGGNIIVTTSEHQLRLNKNSISTDIKVFFANSGMEIIGPEASFKEKVALIQSFLHTVTKLNMEQYNTKNAEDDAGQAYA